MAALVNPSCVCKSCLVSLCVTVSSITRVENEEKSEYGTGISNKLTFHLVDT